MSARYVCDECGELCELLTEAIHVPFRCPMGREAGWEDLDKDEEDEEEEEEEEE